MRVIVVMAVLALATGCSRERIVKVGWDPLAVAPDGYRIFLDDREVRNLPPELLDPACQCLLASVPVPGGKHVVSVVAYSRLGTSPAAKLIVE